MTEMTAGQQTSLTNQSNVWWLKEHQTERRNVGFSYISTVPQPVTLTRHHLLHLLPPTASSVNDRDGVGLSWCFFLAPNFWLPSTLFCGAWERAEREKLSTNISSTWKGRRNGQPASTRQVIPSSFVSKIPQPEMLVETDFLEWPEVEKRVSTRDDDC